MVCLWLTSLLTSLFASHVRGVNVPGIAVNNTLSIGYLLPWSVGWNVGPFMGSAIIPGIEEVKRRQLLPGYDIDFIFRDSGCETLMGFRAGVSVWQDLEDLDVIIGAGCSVVCQPVALLAASWNLPVISWSCASASLSDKDLYPTFTRSVGTYPGLVPEFYAIIRAFGWDRVAVVTYTSEVYQLTALAAKIFFESKGMTVFYHALDMTVAGEQVIASAMAAQQELVRQVKSEAHIVLLTMYGLDVRNFLISCYDEGMLNGEYVFIVIDALYLLTQPFLIRPELGPELLIGVINTQPRTAEGPAYDQFAQDVIDAFSDPVFDGMVKLSANASIDEVDSYAGYVCDAVLMWAYGVNRSLSNNQTLDSGLSITEQLLNFTFEGITGTVTINEFGDRLYDQAIDIMQPDGQSVRLFDWRASDSTLVPVYSQLPPTDWQGIYWAAGVTQVPTGAPPCGWNDELCQETTSNLPSILGGSAGVVCFVALVLAAIYTNRKWQHELAMKQINSFFIAQGDLTSGWLGKSQGSLKTVTELSVNPSRADLGQAADRQNQVAHLKNTLVDIHLYEGINLTAGDNSLLRDLMVIKDLSHENINRFCGVCLMPAGTAVVMVDAARGSLCSLIADPQTKLSWDIKISLATDIVRGMIYLHGSSLGAHGYLTSKSCVVDSRWTCKVSDYGLPTIRKPKRHLETVGGDEAWESLLWTAPELLVGSVGDKTGLKACDIYSFGIIVYELISENMPFDVRSVSGAMEVVTKVRARAAPPFRPLLAADVSTPEWRELAECSWQENPTLRPTFIEALGHLRKINGGTLPKLVDAMIARLEGHTRYLEEIVLERSQEVIQEKAKVEYLLAELLPSSVATQLKSGQTVQPKVHTSISIFFSDIVGFTRVSALSTPIQVVQMLNHLYSGFDQILSLYDVYKVATIGDAYMVASGLPVPNGNKHATEIAKSSLALIKSIQGFSIPHLDGEYLRMRIGIHSGPCVAGVTGTKMPRYLLFGETIDVAAKVEAGGEPMRVHASEATVKLLILCEEFTIERRGPMSIKGLEPITTYWIDSQNNTGEDFGHDGVELNC